jgi:hypothetical protein
MEGDIGDGYVFPVLFTVHPAYCIYNREEGTEYLTDKILPCLKRGHLKEDLMNGY